MLAVFNCRFRGGVCLDWSFDHHVAPTLFRRNIEAVLRHAKPIDGRATDLVAHVDLTMEAVGRY